MRSFMLAMAVLLWQPKSAMPDKAARSPGLAAIEREQAVFQ